MSNVIDMKTGKVLFSENTRAKIQDGLKPYFREDATDATRSQAVNTVEQVLCLAIVAGARNLGEALAGKLVGWLSGNNVTPPPATPDV